MIFYINSRCWKSFEGLRHKAHGKNMKKNIQGMVKKGREDVVDYRIPEK
jgi:hypothetical protein